MSQQSFISSIRSKLFILKELVRVTLDSLSKEPLSRTLGRVKNYWAEPHRFKLLDTHSGDRYEHFLLQQFARLRHEFFAEGVNQQWQQNGPLISVIIPVYNTAPAWLEACVSSVLDQWYHRFEVILYDDASSSSKTLTSLERLKELDKRIQLIRGKENLHISLATNAAIANARGEYIALLDHDDWLEPFALMKVAREIVNTPALDIIYTDEDKIDTKGKRFGPYFKSDLDVDLLRSNNYINHLLVIRKSIGDSVGWMRAGLEGAQDHDLLLRLIEREPKVAHIPVVAYAWRIHPESTAMDHAQKPFAEAAGKRAIEEHLERTGIKADVLSGPWRGGYYVKRTWPVKPMVSILIPFRDQPALLEQCIDSILSNNIYTNFEVLLLDNNSTDPKIMELIKTWSSITNIHHLRYSDDFNFSAINNFGAEHARGELLLFLNNDTKAINPSWLEAMIIQAQRDDVGVVGANLRYEDDTVQHQGVILGIGGFAGHAFRHFPADQHQHFSQGLVRQYTAVTGACMMTKKAVFNELGGFDEEHFKIALNDIDYCLRIRKKGLKVVYTPEAMLYHFESKSRGYEDTPEKKRRLAQEVTELVGRWKYEIENDPFYNPNLTLDREDFSIR